MKESGRHVLGMVMELTFFRMGMFMLDNIKKESHLAKDSINGRMVTHIAVCSLME